jgi:hypothetical protein
VDAAPPRRAPSRYLAIDDEGGGRDRLSPARIGLSCGRRVTYGGDGRIRSRARMLAIGWDEERWTGLLGLDAILVQACPTDQQARAKPQNRSAQRRIRVTEAASNSHGARCWLRPGACGARPLSSALSAGRRHAGHQRGGRQPALPRRPKAKKIHSSGQGKNHKPRVRTASRMTPVMTITSGTSQTTSGGRVGR